MYKGISSYGMGYHMQDGKFLPCDINDAHSHINGGRVVINKALAECFARKISIDKAIELIDENPMTARELIKLFIEKDAIKETLGA